MNLSVVLLTICVGALLIIDILHLSRYHWNDGEGAARNCEQYAQRLEKRVRNQLEELRMFDATAFNKAADLLTNGADANMNELPEETKAAFVILLDVACTKSMIELLRGGAEQ